MLLLLLHTGKFIFHYLLKVHKPLGVEEPVKWNLHSGSYKIGLLVCAFQLNH